AGLSLLLDEEALLAGDRSVVRAHELFVGQLVDPRRNALGEPPRVDENDRRAVLPYQLEQAWIDRRPDAVLPLGAVLVLCREAGHVLDRDLDRHLHRLQPPGVDDGHLAVRAAQKLRPLFKRALRGRQSAPPGSSLRWLPPP